MRAFEEMSTSQRVLVTGCAGFLGSHLCQRLLRDGVKVLGVDCFTDYYGKDVKKANLAGLLEHPRFEFRRIDLSRDPLESLLTGVQIVYHLAGQPGVRGSFGAGFRNYMRHNLEASQRLLDAAADHPMTAFVYASSSSVYGENPAFPTPEDAPKQPLSPYGMTKLATEQISDVYFRTRGIPVIGLRYFSAYGPRQRPDMAFSRFIAQILAGKPITLYGGGAQVRDFTYVDDAVEGTLLAGARGRPGAVYNVGGGSPVTLRDAVDHLIRLLRRPIEIQALPSVPEEPPRTGADLALARDELGFRPTVSLLTGLRRQVDAALGDAARAKRKRLRYRAAT
jgi:UDP-glucuronate 4-epimerase